MRSLVFMKLSGIRDIYKCIRNVRCSGSSKGCEGFKTNIKILGVAI